MLPIPTAVTTATNQVEVELNPVIGVGSTAFNNVTFYFNNTDGHYHLKGLILKHEARIEVSPQILLALEL